MGERGGEIDHPDCRIDGGRLHRGDLVLPQRLAYDVEAGCQRRIAEAALSLPWPCAPDRGGEGLFRVDKLSLRLRQCTCQNGDRFTGPGHGSPPPLSSSVAAPSCTIRFPDRSSGSASPRFSRHRRTRAVSSAPMMIRASEPPMKARRFDGAAPTGCIVPCDIWHLLLVKSTPF